MLGRRCSVWEILLCLCVCTVALILLQIHKYDIPYFKVADDVPVKQRISLVLDLPRNITKPGTLIKLYIDNLQHELKDKRIAHERANHDNIIYNQRKSHVANYCQKRKDDIKPDLKYVQGHMWYLNKDRIMYCPVAKGGSTFWRRAIEVIRRKDPNITSPFQLSYIDFQESNAQIPKAFTTNISKMTSLLDNTFKFMFARDPYHRVFSTFIDKMLSPNPMMWGWGKTATNRFQNGRKANKCGADVTFREYIKLINAQDPKKLEQHLKPVVYSCDACDVNYDVIGKMETFQADTRHILETSGSLNKDIIFKDMKTEYEVDYIVGNVIRAFDFKRGWNKCISAFAGFQRLWRQLQIAGLVDKADEYPLTASQSDTVTVTEYMNLALSAFKKSTSSAKQNKQEAYMQAYSTIDSSDMEALRKIYIADFEMFDYEQKPAELFPERKAPKTTFDYFDVMRMI